MHMTPSGSRAALFVDFDNVFSGLARLEPAAAKTFATQPGIWLSAVVGERELRFLIQTCYLNPTVYSAYRAFWVRAGFRVVDTPSLTRQNKSSADIHLVIDVLDALTADVPVDEFIIAADDADFTSLIRRIRETDRFSTVVIAGPVASAYRSVADRVIDSVDLLDRIGGEAGVLSRDPDVDYAELDEGSTRHDGDLQTGEDSEVLRGKIIDHLHSASGPIDLASLAHLARSWGATSLRSWAQGGFRAWLSAAGEDVVQISSEPGQPGYAWDPRRFNRGDLPDFGFGESPGAIATVFRVTDVPRLSKAQYRAALTALDDEHRRRPGLSSETSRNVRDACREMGEPVGRNAVNFIIRGLQYEDFNFHRPGNIHEIASSWTRNVENLCASARIELTDDQGLELREWVSGGLLEDSPGTSDASASEDAPDSEGRPESDLDDV